MLIKELRKALNLRQEEFGEKLGVSHAAISKWEKGESPHPSRVLQICQTFGVNRAWLETGVGEMFEQPAEDEKEDEATARRRFFVETFDSLPEELQQIIIDALKSRLKDTTPKEEPKEPDEEENVLLIKPKIPRPGDRIAADPLL